jgi:hypothetical protein
MKWSKQEEKKGQGNQQWYERYQVPSPFLLVDGLILPDLLCSI